MEQVNEEGDDQLKHWELTKEEGIAELHPTVPLVSEDTTRYESRTLFRSGSHSDVLLFMHAILTCMIHIHKYK